MRLSFTNLLLAFGFALAMLTQCTMHESVSENPTGPTLKFRLVRIEEATLGGVDVKEMRQPDDLGLEPRSQIIRKYVSGNLPLRMKLLLEARDPSLAAGTLSSLDYEVFLDDKLLGKAQATPNIALPMDGSPTQFPLAFDLNTRKILGNDAMPALRNFAVGLADRRRRPMRLGLRLRPSSIAAGGQTNTASNFLLVEMDSVAAPMP